jgi:large subunit ribosomal protein L25
VAHVVSIREEAPAVVEGVDAATVSTAGTPAEPEVAKKGKTEAEPAAAKKGEAKK